MPSGVQVASLFGVLSLDDSAFKSGLTNAKTGLSGLGTQMQNVGSNMQRAGGQLMTATAPMVGMFGVATQQAMKFDEAVTNTGAVLGLNRDQIEAMKDQLLEIGGSTRAGPQAVADAMYDIAGGVADASTHMAILGAAIHTSQAGNADLQGTTQALISTMNSYGYSAEQAGMVSDVLTQTVGKGVGTMDQFAAALPQVTGLAATLGIPLQDVGSMMAFLTTKGNTASEAATMLGANMSALMKPNEDMKDALAELGFTSGEAAIEQMGLVGALQAVGRTSVAGSEGMSALLGTQEAVRGSVALLGDDFAGFSETFKQGVDGITAKAEEIQMGSPAAQFDLLRSQVSEAAISLGEALAPALSDAMTEIKPLVDDVTRWIGQNPELVTQIALLTGGGLLLGGALSIVGTVVSTGGALLTGVGALLGLLLTPVGLVAMIGALVALLASGEGGLEGGLKRAAVAFGQLTSIINQELPRYLQDLTTKFLGLTESLQKFESSRGIIQSGLPANLQLGATQLNYVKPTANLGNSVFNPNQNAGGMAAGYTGMIFGLGGVKDAYQRALEQQARDRAGRAAGGSVMAGGTYLVGENGPELFTPVSSGNISSNRDTMGMMGGIQIGSIVINANTRAGGEAAMDGALARLNARGR